MKAFRITYEMLEERGVTDEDVHSLRARLRAYEQREAEHIAGRKLLQRGYTLRADKDQPVFVDGKILYRTKREPYKIDRSDWGLYLVSGNKGTGKSLVISALAEKDYRAGRLVFSNLGFCYGYQFTAMDLYLAVAGAPKDAVIVVDEAHQPLGNIGSGSYRIDTVRQLLAGLRKSNQKVYLMSSQPDNIDGRILNEVDWAMTPRNTYPGKEKARAHQSGKLAFAGKPWLWRSLIRIGPQPYKRRKGRASDIFAAYGINVHGVPPTKGVLTIPPARLWQASKGYDSFSPLLNPKDTGMGVHAADIKDGLSEPDWLDFDDTNAEDAMAAAAAGVSDAEKEYASIRASAFLNALLIGIQAQGLTRGSYSFRWAADQARENLRLMPSHGDGLKVQLAQCYARLPKNKQTGDPTEFQELDARLYLSEFLGQEGNAFSIDHFWQNVRASQARGG